MCWDSFLMIAVGLASSCQRVQWDACTNCSNCIFIAIFLLQEVLTSHKINHVVHMLECCQIRQQNITGTHMHTFVSDGTVYLNMQKERIERGSRKQAGFNTRNSFRRCCAPHTRTLHKSGVLCLSAARFALELHKLERGELILMALRGAFIPAEPEQMLQKQFRKKNRLILFLFCVSVC